MNKIAFCVLQIFFLASIAYSDGTLMGSGSLPAFFQTVTSFTKASPGSSTFVAPILQRTTDLLVDVSSNAARWLGSSVLIFKLGHLFQQNLQNTEEIEKEAEHLGRLGDDLFKRKKSIAKLQDERNQKIKELREKISESRFTVRLKEEGKPSEEEMMEELYRLLTEKLQPNFGQEDEESEIAAVESAPGVLEQPAVSGSYVVPGMWMAPGVGSSGFPSISTADEQELLIARCVPSMSEYALKQKSLDELKTDLNDKFEELRKFSCCSSCCPNIAGNRFSRYGLFGRHQTVEGNYYHHTITTYLDDWRFESHAGCGGACLIGVYCFMYHFMVIGIPCAWCDFFNINFSDDKEKYNNLIDETNLINNAIKIKLKTEMK